jgi:eukaryotic-like serine/threonine-protein kinase
VLASLNHPNIGSIYGLEEADGVKALVLELIEGPTLADRIKQGPIPIDEALPIAKQIAEALEAAHEQGVIHRDLKPANVKVKADGTVKVLDFGLAKAFQSDASDPNMSLSPTISLTASATAMGMVIGTAAYMAPEQAKGRVVDRRADVWALGAVLYEMLTGQKPFTGDDVSTTLARVIEREPDWDALPSTLSPVLATYVRRCLTKDPKQRIPDVATMRLALEGAFETTVGPASAPAGTPELLAWQRPVAIAVTVLAAVVLTGLAVWSQARPGPPAPRPLAQFVLQTPPDGPLRAAGMPQLAISPDGTRVVYGSGRGDQDRRLFVRRLGELDATPLRGAEGGDAPFFSSDGQSVGFRALGDTLKQVSVLGGPAVTIVEAESRGVSWGPDGSVVFGSQRGLMRVRPAGGEPEPLTTVDADRGESHRFPHILPNLKGVLFTVWSGTDETRLAVVSLETGAVSDLLEGGGKRPRYAPTGHIVYGVGNTLRAVGFDADRLELTSSTPVTVVASVHTTSQGAANFALADNGTLVYVLGTSAGVSRPQRALVWVDRQGREEPLSTPVENLSSPRVSPDGTRVAFSIRGPDFRDGIWIHDLVRGTETLFTTDPANSRDPLWTPDGAGVVFASDRDGSPALFQKLVDTPGAAERLMTASAGSTDIQPLSWSAAGQTLLYWETGAASDIGLLSMEGDRATELLLETAASESLPAVSPNGDWIAYESDETGQAEVYVQRFPRLGGKQTISTDGGEQPLWSPDGRELFYRAPTGGLMVVPVLETEPTFSAGDPAVLVDTSYVFAFGAGGRSYDIHPDGQRFLMVGEASSADRQIILVENWFDELQRLVPVL